MHARARERAGTRAHTEIWTFYSTEWSGLNRAIYYKNIVTRVEFSTERKFIKMHMAIRATLLIVGGEGGDLGLSTN